MFINGDKNNNNPKSIRLIDLYDLTRKDDLEYIFRGDFSSKIVSGILDLAKTTLKESSDTYRIKSKIYYIMGESLQNIARHHCETFYQSPDKYSLFAIHKKNFKYYITSGNIVEIKDIDGIKYKIEKINSLGHDDLREYSRTTRSTGALSEKGGAGLGLIEIAKRSGNKLEYDFKEINDSFSYFYLNTEIPVLNKPEAEPKTDYKYSIENIKELHEILVKDNVILFFKGAFNQNSLLNLLSIVESQLKESTITIKIYNIMVELLQNISKHADNFSVEIDWKPGIFMITETKDKFMLISGNYVKNAKTDALKRNIEYVNDLSFSQLVIEYNRILQDFDLKNNNAGLGLIDLKRKSKQNLDYSFHEIDKDLSFFTLQVSISKINKLSTLIIDATEETPRIHFDPDNNLFEITNKSLPEDADEFYRPIIVWLESYKLKPNKNTNFTFKLDYYNTSSSRYITRIIKILDDMARKHEVKIFWYYREIDEDMQSMGEEYFEMTDLEFELVET
ncbi:MAG: hypothetical protein B6I20_03325 [Bacteroidetes bacterium 4572_117]|nr:MAG: hypothetical protein B6I20_03325 [Bacteroidetes bacterium 4572_117]